MKKLRTGNVYNIRHRVLNSLRHGAVPQNRPRVYIVGIKRTVQVRPFRWPLPKLTPPLRAFLDNQAEAENIEDMTRTTTANLSAAHRDLRKRKIDPRLAEIVVDIGAGKKRRHWTQGHVPCITKSRGGARAFWSTKRSRRLKAKELARLQGFRDHDLALDGLSDHKIGELMGNAMTVGVLQGVLRGALRAIGKI